MLPVSTQACPLCFAVSHPQQMVLASMQEHEPPHNPAGSQYLSVLEKWDAPTFRQSAFPEHDNEALKQIDLYLNHESELLLRRQFEFAQPEEETVYKETQ